VLEILGRVGYKGIDCSKLSFRCTGMAVKLRRLQRREAFGVLLWTLHNSFAKGEDVGISPFGPIEVSELEVCLRDVLSCVEG